MTGGDPALIRAWLTARSICRGLPAPVEDNGGLRVDIGLPTEQKRWVFAAMTPGLRALGERIDAPLHFLKLCGTDEELSAALPRRWALAPASYVMTVDTPQAAPVQLPHGLRIETHREGPVSSVVIRAADGTLAASGHAAETEEAFVFDRIVTEAAFQRLGLGSAVMASLAAARRSSAARCILVATEDGRALYRRLGWSVHSPYASALIPGPSLA